MTGFGRYENIDEERKVIIEIKAVNHKYCDINIRMPKKLIVFENAIRNLIKQYVKRGKIDLYITYEDYAKGAYKVKYNEDLAMEYLSTFSQMNKVFDIENDIKVSHLSRFPEIISLEESSVDEETLLGIINDAITKALVKLVETRTTEGNHLKIDIEKKLTKMKSALNSIKAYAPKVVENYQCKLETRLNELLKDHSIDENKIATEVAFFADKACIDEEIVRLESHMTTMKDTLQKSEDIGRRLDFIAQEMNREANTILSKANDINVSNIGIELKSEIEKIREQIQNIE